METAKLFKNGQSQAVRLPKAFRFSGDEVYIKKVGNAVVLLPIDDPWGPLLSAMGEASDDFMAERLQPPQDHRDVAFE